MSGRDNPSSARARPSTHPKPSTRPARGTRSSTAKWRSTRVRPASAPGTGSGPVRRRSSTGKKAVSKKKTAAKRGSAKKSTTKKGSARTVRFRGPSSLEATRIIPARGRGVPFVSRSRRRLSLFETADEAAVAGRTKARTKGRQRKDCRALNTQTKLNSFWATTLGKFARIRDIIRCKTARLLQRGDAASAAEWREVAADRRRMLGELGLVEGWMARCVDGLRVAREADPSLPSMSNPALVLTFEEVVGRQ